MLSSSSSSSLNAALMMIRCVLKDPLKMLLVRVKLVFFFFAMAQQTRDPNARIIPSFFF
jgi:hypothetical protein